MRLLKSFLQTIALSVFLSFLGGLFVALAVMLGKPELVLLLVILLLVILLKSFFGENESLAFFQDFPLVGDATHILSSLHSFYQKNPPSSGLRYLFYPVSSVIGFWRTPKYTRKELARYFALIHWIILVLFVEGFLMTIHLSQAFDIWFALSWAILEFVFVYFLCNFFAIPCMVSAIRLSLAGYRRRLFVVVFCTLACLIGFFYYFTEVHSFSGLVPTNIALKQELRPENGSPFLQDMQESTSMFLSHYLPKIQKTIEQEDTSNPCGVENYLAKVNEKYQRVLQGLSLYDEYSLFYLTTNQDKEDLWGIACVPLRNSILFAFRYREKKLTIFTRWQDMSAKEQEQFRVRWNEDAYRPYREKQFARVIIEETEQALEKLENLMPKKRAQSQDKQEGMLSEKRSKNKTCSLEQTMLPGSVLGEQEQQELRELRQEWERISQKFTEIELNAAKEREQLREVCENLLRELQLFRHRSPSTFAERPDSALREIIASWSDKWPIQLPNGLRDRLTALQSYEDAVEQSRYARASCAHLLEQGSIEQLKRELQEVEQMLERISQMRPVYSEILELLENTRCNFHQYRKSTFVIYDDEMAAFEFPRALQWKFIDDHQGTGPRASTENAESQALAWTVRILLAVFGIFMPIHVLLIIFCYWKGYGKSEIQ